MHSNSLSPGSKDYENVNQKERESSMKKYDFINVKKKDENQRKLSRNYKDSFMTLSKIDDKS